MDSLSTGNVDLTKLSDRDKQELQQFVVNESQKARIQGCTRHHSIAPSSPSPMPPPPPPPPPVQNPQSSSIHPYTARS
ncbi:hypothetical protein BK809_0006037 [Diplodia seriata]|uniref:Uncharacterized protein n=1 Tax=Diplodia seriata TaxID=420778 RepID=A0A1S8BP45_9PEZI|nr:hypothetical protein BK809_0006037 [Diplodia seriata]